MAQIEYFDIYNVNNESINTIKERRLVHQDGDWHRTSQIWIMNDQKDILCNLRSINKDVFAHYWDLSIGGHVSAGDSYEVTAVRELKEEIGIDVTIEELEVLGDEKIDGGDVEKRLTDREHARLFLYLTDRKIEDFKIQEEEIEEIRFVPANELIKIIKEDNISFRVVPTKHFYVKILERLLAWRL